jgi:hypothetical protein
MPNSLAISVPDPEPGMVDVKLGQTLRIGPGKVSI